MAYEFLQECLSANFDNDRWFREFYYLEADLMDERIEGPRL